MATKTKKRPTTIPGLEGLDLTGLSPDDVTSIRGQQALVYSPQLNQIRDLHRQLTDQYHSDLTSAGTNADSARMYATKAIPEVQQIFHNAKTAAQAGTDTVNGVMDKYGAGSGADPFRRALAREQQSAADRISTEGAKAQQELQDRVTAAESGRQYAITAAKKDYRKGTDTLSQKLLDILQEQGATTAGLAANIRGTKMSTAASVLKDQARLDAKSADKKAAADAKAAEQARKDKAAETKRVAGVRTASGDYVNKVADAAAEWKRYTETGIAVKIPDPDNAGKQIQKTYEADGVDSFGRKVKAGDPVFRQATTNEIRNQLGTMRDTDGHLKYTPGDIHVMLLRRANKPLDAAALGYLRKLANHGVRIPRDWLQAAYGGRAPGNTAPPTGRPTGGS